MHDAVAMHAHIRRYVSDVLLRKVFRLLLTERQS